MLQTVRERSDRREAYAPTPPVPTPAEGDYIDLRAVLAAGRRQIWPLAICVGIALAVGLAYLASATPIYTAEARILFDDQRNRLLDEFATFSAIVESDAAILGQIELVKSPRLALAVVDQLHLVGDPNLFSAFGPSVFGRIRGTVMGTIARFGRPTSDQPAIAPSPEVLRGATAEALAASMSVNRLGRSYILRLAFSSSSPTQAAAVVNAYTAAYIDDQRQSAVEAGRQAAAWLENRIDDLTKRATEADLAVETFRRDNGLVTTDGRLVSEQQLAGVITQLVAAQAETTEAEARAHQVQTAIEAGPGKAVDNSMIITASNAGDIMNTLRAAYIDASKRRDEVADRFGPDHAQALALEREMERYQQQIFDELTRMGDAFNHELSVAELREATLQTSVDSLIGTNAGDNENLVVLRNLQQKADAYRDLLQSSLAQSEGIVQQQSFPIARVRSISDASPPLAPSGPSGKLTIAAALLLGLAAGAGIGGIREARERFFRTGDQVRRELGIAYLGVIPRIRDVRLRRGRRTAMLAAGVSALPSISAGRHDRLRLGLDAPASPLAETLRNTRLAADAPAGNRRSKIIAMVAVLPGEGASTVAANFAQMLAKQGANVVLVDANLRDRGLTGALTPQAKLGLPDVLTHAARLADVMHLDPVTGLRFLPGGAGPAAIDPSVLLASDAMDGLLAEIGDADYVIVDLPPIAPFADARFFASRADGFVLVTEWGKTERRAVSSTLAAEPEVYGRCLGAILNKTNLRRMRQYNPSGGIEYYYSKHRA